MNGGTKGLFLVFEGIDGSGKSTQAGLLADALTQRGFKVDIFREPGGTSLGESIRRLLLDEANSNLEPSAETLLFAGARAQLVAGKIRPAIEAGRIVINDRFEDSTFAYQGFGRGLALEILSHINHLATGGLKANMTFLLDIAPELARKRLQRDEDRLEQEAISFFQRVRKGYLSLAGNKPGSCLVLDASRSIQDIHSQIIKTAEEVIGETTAGSNRSQ